MDTTTEPKKKSTTWNWITIIIGVLICCAGMLSWFGEDEATNNTMIEAGISQSCTALLTEYPEVKPHLAKLADTLDAAIEARTTSPEELANLITATLTEVSGQQINVDAFVKAFVNKINEAHKVSATEEQYHTKLKVMIAGIRNTLN